MQEQSHVYLKSQHETNSETTTNITKYIFQMEGTTQMRHQNRAL